MHTTADQHPSQAELATFVAGKLNPRMSDWVRRHLSGCPACSTVVEGIVKTTKEPLSQVSDRESRADQGDAAIGDGH